jgi:glycosyltransferase involved in cell wall biosynthesis
MLKTLKTVQDSVATLVAKHDVSCVVTLILDTPDSRTLEVAESACKTYQNTRISISDFRDLGLSRNQGIQESSADWIAFVDADDLWGQSWLSLAFSASVQNPGAIFHPEISYYFGSSTTRESNIVARHISSTDSDFDPFTLSTENYWTSACFASRAIFLDSPYRPVNKAKRIGMEDWTFNLETLGKGIQHLVVRDSVHFIRDKPVGSMRDDHSSYSAFHYPVKYL